MSDSNTAIICENLALYAHGCATDAPETEHCEIAACEMLDMLANVFADTCMEQETEELLWQLVNVFHRKTQTLEHLLDANMLRQKTLIKQQDGSEINSVELETATEEGRAIETHLRIMEAMREAGAERFSCLTGSAWLPKSGSRGSHQAVTASVIDSRDMINARNLQKITRVIPTGKRIAIAPGRCNDHAKIWAVLDEVLAKFTARSEGMVLLHGGSDGVEKIAAFWAKNRNVPQVVFRPDWVRDGRAAPFRRNDAILEEKPDGLVVIGNDEQHGIQQQLIRNARTHSVKIYVR